MTEASLHEKSLNVQNFHGIGAGVCFGDDVEFKCHEKGGGSMSSAFIA